MKRPVTNMIAILAGDIGSRIIGFLVTLYLARVLAPASFGVINIGVAVLGYLSLLGSPGIQMVETRNAAAAEGGMPERAISILFMRLALAPPLICLTYAIVVLSGVPAETREVIGLYSLSLLPLALSLDWLFQGKEDFRGVMISRLLNAVVFGLIVVLMVRSASQLAVAPVAFLAGNVAAVLFLGVMYRRRFGLPELRWDPRAWLQVFRENAPAGTAMFLAQSVTNLPPIVIGILLSNADAGIYSAGMKLIFLLLLADRTLNALFLPVATRYAVARPAEFPVLISAALSALFVLMVPVLIGTCIVARPVVALVFGPGYEGAVPILRVLTGYVLLTLLNSIFICTLIAFGKTKTYSLIVGGGAAVLCVAVVAATAVLGAVGAGAGIIAGEAVMLCLLILAAARAAPLPSFRFLFKPVIAGGAMAAAAVALDRFPPVLSLFAALTLFVVLLVSMNGLPREEFRYLRERLI